MLTIVQPSAIRFKGKLAVYCYHCPGCYLRLSKKSPKSNFYKMFLRGISLKIYTCDRCGRDYFAHAAMHHIRQHPLQIKYSLKLDELFQG